MADPLAQAKSLAKYNNQLAISNAKQAQQFNSNEAAKNRNWQERMANSAHQREIKDLKAAGLNPVLSVTGGNGAATTSGATASGQAATVDTSLPRAVMDMAMAQMNNAALLQRVSMETQNAMAIATLNNQRSWMEHITPGGNTTFGQILYGLDQIYGLGSAEKMSGLNKHAKDIFYNGTSLKSILDRTTGGKTVDQMIDDLTKGKNTSNRRKKSSRNSYGSVGDYLRFMALPSGTSSIKSIARKALKNSKKKSGKNSKRK